MDFNTLSTTQSHQNENWKGGVQNVTYPFKSHMQPTNVLSSSWALWIDGAALSSKPQFLPRKLSIWLPCGTVWTCVLHVEFFCFCFSTLVKHLISRWAPSTWIWFKPSNKWQNIGFCIGLQPLYYTYLVINKHAPLLFRINQSFIAYEENPASHSSEIIHLL